MPYQDIRKKTKVVSENNFPREPLPRTMVILGVGVCVCATETATKIALFHSQRHPCTMWKRAMELEVVPCKKKAGVSSRFTHNLNFVWLDRLCCNTFSSPAVDIVLKQRLRLCREYLQELVPDEDVFVVVRKYHLRRGADELLADQSTCSLRLATRQAGLMNPRLKVLPRADLPNQ